MSEIERAEAEVEYLQMRLERATTERVKAHWKRQLKAAEKRLAELKT